MTIPDLKHDSAVTIISEIGIDMAQFCNSKRLYAAGQVLHQTATHLAVRRSRASLLITKRNMNLL